MAAYQEDKLFNRKSSVLLLVSFLAVLTPIDADVNDCQSYQSSCDECIKGGPLCNWCASSPLNYKGKERCSQSKKDCPINDTINIKSKITIHQNEVNIDLRDDELVKFQVNVSSNPGLPFDIYVLIDGSRSMSWSLDWIKSNLTSLAEMISNKWKGSKVGLGIFNDKETTPFTFTNFSTLGLRKNIPGFEMPYWSMLVKLGESRVDFNKSVNGVNVTYSYDPDGDPEATLDVMAQALACKDVLGFQNNSGTRHLIFVTTNSPFWAAGDGRFGAIINPPTTECRGDTTDKQSAKSFLYDHPSVGLFKWLLQQKQIYLLMSVTNDKFHNDPYYLASFAEINDNIYSAFQEELKGLMEYVPNWVDSSPEVNSPYVPLNATAVMEKLEQVSKKVSLVPSGDTEKFVIKTYIDKNACRFYNHANDPEEPDNEKTLPYCNNVPKNRQVEVWVTVQQKKGVTLDGQKTFFLNLPGVHLQQPLFTVNVKPRNSKCDNGTCQKSDKKADENICSGNGELVCGVCQCKEGFHGARCDCNTEVEIGEQVEKNCKGYGPYPDQLCNARGTCYCGVCECKRNFFNHTYLGELCQCDPAGCPKGANGEICNGNGECVCKEQKMMCNCNKGFNASNNCKCKDDTFCLDPNFRDGFLCNGRSTRCGCDGKCTCLNSFKGDYCEQCDSALCMASVCREKRYLDLVKCFLGLIPESECKTSDKYFNVSTDTEVTERGGWKKCTFAAFTCLVDFYVTNQSQSNAYHVENNLLNVIVDQKIKCQDRMENWVIVVVVSSSVLILGFLVISIWKICIVLQERKEYKEFLQAQEGTPLIK